MKRGSGLGERKRERRKKGRMMTAPGSAPLLTKAAKTLSCHDDRLEQPEERSREREREGGGLGGRNRSRERKRERLKKEQ